MYSYELSKQRQAIEQLEIDVDEFMLHRRDFQEVVMNRIEELEYNVDLLLKELKTRDKNGRTDKRRL